MDVDVMPCNSVSVIPNIPIVDTLSVDKAPPRRATERRRQRSVSSFSLVSLNSVVRQLRYDPNPELRLFMFLGERPLAPNVLIIRLWLWAGHKS